MGRMLGSWIEHGRLYLLYLWLYLSSLWELQLWESQTPTLAHHIPRRHLVLGIYLCMISVTIYLYIILGGALPTWARSPLSGANLNSKWGGCNLPQALPTLPQGWHNIKVC